MAAKTWKKTINKLDRKCRMCGFEHRDQNNRPCQCPTPEQIRERAEQIQATWPARVEAIRRVIPRAAWSLPCIVELGQMEVRRPGWGELV